MKWAFFFWRSWYWLNYYKKSEDQDFESSVVQIQILYFLFYLIIIYMIYWDCMDSMDITVLRLQERAGKGMFVKPSILALRR